MWHIIHVTVTFKVPYQILKEYIVRCSKQLHVTLLRQKDLLFTNFPNFCLLEMFGIPLTVALIKLDDIMHNVHILLIGWHVCMDVCL